MKNRQEISDNHEHYKDIYNDFPIGIWEEDWSEVKKAFDKLTKENVTDIIQHLKDHPELLIELVNKTRTLSANQTALDIYEASSYQQIMEQSYEQPDFISYFLGIAQQLVEGETVFSISFSDRSIKGKDLYIRETYRLPEASKDSWSWLIVVSEEINAIPHDNASIIVSKNYVNQAAAIANIGYWKLDKEGKTLTHTTHEYRSLLGISVLKDPIRHSTIYSVIHPDDRTNIKNVKQQALANQTSYNINFRIINDQNETKYINEIAEPEYNSSGNFCGLTGIIQDITEIQLKELQLSESEQKYSILFNDLPLSVWEEDWSLVRIAINQLELEGVSNIIDHLQERPELCTSLYSGIKILSHNKQALKLYHANAVDEAERLIDQSPTTPDYLLKALKHLLQNKTSFIISSWDITTDGTAIHFQDSFRLLDSTKDDWSNLIIISQDTTEEERQKQLTHNNKEKLERAAAIAKLGYWMSEFGDNPIIHTSGCYKSIHGLPDNDEPIYQNDINALMHPDDVQEVKTTFDAADASEQSYMVDYRIIISNGDIRYVRELGDRYIDSLSGFLGHQGTVQDITDIKLQELRIEETEKKARQQQNLYISALNIVESGLGLYSSTSGLIFCNAYFKAIANDASNNGKTYLDLLKYLSKYEIEHNQDALTKWESLFNIDSENINEPFDIKIYDTWYQVRLSYLDDDMFSIAINDISEVKERQHELEHLAQHDALTGLSNRRFFDDVLANEFVRIKRTHTPLSLILCDIDHFKPYNDNYGHVQGDECLRQVAEVIRLTFNRSIDTAVRYGGEEFAMILPVSKLDEASLMAEKLRSNLADAKILHEYSSVTDHITFSLGVASISPDARLESEMDLIQAADAALYLAKKSGKNCVKSTQLN